MPDRDELCLMAAKLDALVRDLFQRGGAEVILFGSYARGDAETGSDVDLLLLVDASREEIAEKSWQIGEAAAELLFEHGVVVSPIVENRGFYQENRAMLPLFRNVDREGVRLLA